MRTSSLLKGQAMFGDFILSIVIFFALLVLVFVSFQTFENQVATASNRIDIATFTKQTSDSLFGTQGTPVNWNANTVTQIGLSTAKSGVIDGAKLLSLIDISYSNTKLKSGFGAYEFNLTFYENENLIRTGIAQNRIALFTQSQSPLFLSLNSSNLTWDLYASNSSSLGSLSSRYSFFGTKSSAVNRLVDNLSNYNTVIFEDANSVSVNNSAVVAFLNKSGSVIYVGNTSSSFFSSGLGATFASSQNEYGNVVNYSFIVRNVNSTSYFANSFAYAIFNGSNVNASLYDGYISRQVNASHCLACSWNYLFGRIYYFANFNSSFGVLSGSQVYNIIGSTASFGTPLPSDTGDAFVLNVPVVLKFYHGVAVRAKLIVWSNVK